MVSLVVLSCSRTRYAGTSLAWPMNLRLFLLFDPPLSHKVSVTKTDTTGCTDEARWKGRFLEDNTHTSTHRYLRTWYIVIPGCCCCCLHVVVGCCCCCCLEIKSFLSTQLHQYTQSPSWFLIRERYWFCGHVLSTQLISTLSVRPNLLPYYGIGPTVHSKTYCCTYFPLFTINNNIRSYLLPGMVPGNRETLLIMWYVVTD